MKLSGLIKSARIRYKLLSEKSSYDPDISGIALLDGATDTYKTDILYVGYAEQMSTGAIPKNCILAGELSGGCRSGISNLLLVDRKDLFSLFNFLNGLIANSGGREVYDMLRTVADQEKNPTAVINAAASILGNPLLVVDTDYRIIAYSSSVQITDRLWHKNTKQGFCSYQFVLGVKQLLEQQAAVLSTYPSELTCTESPCSMVVIFIQPRNQLGQKYIKTALMPEISAAVPGAHAAYHDNGIVCLLSDEVGKDSILASLSHIGGDVVDGIRIGVSNTFDQIGNLYVHYKQARHALELHARYGGSSNICRYADYQLLDLISSAGKSLPLAQYGAPVLSDIRRYDAENGTFLYDTLQTYLNCNCSIKDTAYAMFLHRNTVVYRLERLKELWNLDFEDAQKKLLLQVSFLIDKCTDNK